MSILGIFPWWRRGRAFRASLDGLRVLRTAEQYETASAWIEAAQAETDWCNENPEWLVFAGQDPEQSGKIVFLIPDGPFAPAGLHPSELIQYPSTGPRTIWRVAVPDKGGRADQYLAAWMAAEKRIAGRDYASHFETIAERLEVVRRVLCVFPQERPEEAA